MVIDMIRHSCAHSQGNCGKIAEHPMLFSVQQPTACSYRNTVYILHTAAYYLLILYAAITTVCTQFLSKK